MNVGSYEQYFAIWGPSGTQMFRADEHQKSRIINEDSVRAAPGLRDYRGPLILFSYMPAREQIIFQNVHPDDMKEYEVYSRMLADIKSRVSKTKKIAEDKLIVTHDDTMNSPFVTTMSKQGVLWDYIKNFLAPTVGIEAKDIYVIEAPLSREGNIKAMFVRGPEEENDLPAMKEAKISHGISIPFPFIAVESRISNLGEKYHALLHEYAHYVQKLRDVPHIAYSFEGGINAGANDQERDRRFVEYINNPLEQDAHMRQMIYMLEMGMSPAEVLDFFAPRKSLLHRAEYGKIIDQAIKIYADNKAERRKKPADIQKPTEKTARLSPGINDWWYLGLQEQMNEAQHSNNPLAPTSKPYNLRKTKPVPSSAPKTTEGLLSLKHDKEMSYMKSAEQLLQESRT
jgi:hypothetical protein